MSKQNQKTLDVYEQTAQLYLDNSVIHEQSEPAKAKRKRAKLNEFIRDSFAPLPQGARIFEIGSAGGDDADCLEKLGYDVTASDVSQAFLDILAAGKHKVVKFNVLEDEFPGSYHGIFCWRVFVHFTPEDAAEVLKKTYAALEPGGRFVFNAINRATREVDQEWVDFEGDYHMGVKRFFNYFSEEQLRKLIAQTDYRIVHFHTEGGDTKNKWLVFVLEK